MRIALQKNTCSRQCRHVSTHDSQNEREREREREKEREGEREREREERQRDFNILFMCSCAQHTVNAHNTPFPATQS